MRYIPKFPVRKHTEPVEIQEFKSKYICRFKPLVIKRITKNKNDFIKEADVEILSKAKLLSKIGSENLKLVESVLASMDNLNATLDYLINNGKIEVGTLIEERHRENIVNFSNELIREVNLHKIDNKIS